MGNRARMVAGPACEEMNYFERERSKIARDDVTEAKRSRQLDREENRWRAISTQSQ